MTARLTAALDATLAALLGDDGWRTDEATRLAHAEDDSRRHALPDAVAFPRTREQVAALVRVCREHRMPLIARGSGTGTTGATIRIYIERYEADEDKLALDTQEALAELIAIAEKIIQVKAITGFKAPTAII